MLRRPMRTPDQPTTQTTCIVIEVRDETGRLIASAPVQLDERVVNDASTRAASDQDNFYSILM